MQKKDADQRRSAPVCKVEISAQEFAELKAGIVKAIFRSLRMAAKYYRNLLMLKAMIVMEQNYCAISV